MTKYQDLEPGKGGEAEYQDSWPQESDPEGPSSPNYRPWTARQGAKRRGAWVCVKLIALLSALLALTWSFRSGALSFLRTAQQEGIYEDSWEFSNLKDFKLHNLVTPHRNSRCRDPFKSTFVVLRAEQEGDVVVHFSLKVSAHELLDDLKVDKDDQSLVITYPNTHDDFREKECIETHTEMHVRRGLKLQNLDIKYIIGEFTIPEALELTVDHAEIYLALASLHSNQFDGRKANFTVEAGSVTGTFALLDELSITTRLGTINATIDPKPANPSAVQPASFSATSDFGMIDINFFPSLIAPGGAAIPPRDYRTSVASQAGAIVGRYLHGSATTLTTELGAIDVALLPVAVPDRDADDETLLATRTERGAVSVALLDPGVVAGVDGDAAAAALSGLQSDHSSRLGAVSAQYPAAWQGAVEGESRLGRVRMAGEGLEILRRSRKGMGMVVDGRKGEVARANVLCTTEMGAVEFIVGGH